MYIANTTRQNIHFWCRLPERRAPTPIPIPAGGQVIVGSKWTSSEIASFVEQIEEFGGRQAGEANKKLRKYAGLLYSFDKPVTDDQFLNAHEKVKEDQHNRSVVELTKAAARRDMAVRREAKIGKTKTTSLSVSQDVPFNQRGTGKEVNFDVSVTPDGHDAVPLSVDD